MDSKGIINIEYVFCIIIGMFILISYIPYLEENIDNNKQTMENAETRFLLNEISSSINQVNSNNYEFSKRIDLPNKIENNSYQITIRSREIIIETNDKKGKENINPINLVNTNNESINEVKLYNGNSYILKKSLIEDNKTKLFNQSSIIIKPLIE